MSEMLKWWFPMLHKIKWGHVLTTQQIILILFLIRFKSQANKVYIVQLRAHLRSHWHWYVGMVFSGTRRQKLE